MGRSRNRSRNTVCWGRVYSKGTVCCAFCHRYLDYGEKSVRTYFDDGYVDTCKRCYKRYVRGADIRDMLTKNEELLRDITSLNLQQCRYALMLISEFGYSTKTAVEKANDARGLIDALSKIKTDKKTA